MAIGSGENRFAWRRFDFRRLFANARRTDPIATLEFAALTPKVITMLARPPIVLVLLSSVFYVGSAPAQGVDPATKKKVLDEYLQAVDRLEARYNRSKGVASKQVVEKKTPNSLPPGRGLREDRLDFEFASLRPERAMVVVHNPASTRSDAFAIGYNPAYGFVLTKGKGNAGYAVRDVVPEGKSQRSTWNSYVGPFLDAPYSLGLLDTKTFVSSPSLKSLDVVETALDGKKCWKIVFDKPRPIAGRDTSGGYQGWFIVSPEESWAVREYEFKPKVAKFVWTGNLTYEGREAGFPLLKRVVHATRWLADQEAVRTETYDFQELKFEDAPLDQFRLPFFGLPEILDPPGGVKPKVGAS